MQRHVILGVNNNFKLPLNVNKNHTSWREENMFFKVIEKLFVASFHTICTVGNDRQWHVSIGSL